MHCCLTFALYELTNAGTSRTLGLQAYEQSGFLSPWSVRESLFSRRLM